MFCMFVFFPVHGEYCLGWLQMGPGRSFSGQSRPCRHFGRHGFGFGEFPVVIFVFVVDSNFMDVQVHVHRTHWSCKLDNTTIYISCMFVDQLFYSNIVWWEQSGWEAICLLGQTKIFLGSSTCVVSFAGWLFQVLVSI